jgi:hypothetical protein
LISTLWRHVACSLEGMQQLSKLSFVLAAIMGVLGVGCDDDDDDVVVIGEEISVVNSSDFEIDELHLATLDSPTWGDNLLGNDALDPGDAVVLDVPCGTFDVLLVGDNDVECMLSAIDLCLNNSTFVINNDTCAVFDD